MDNFQAIGQLVTEARHLLDAIKGGAIRQMEVAFDALKVSSTTTFNQLISGFNSTFNGKLASYQNQMNLVTRPIMENINGVDVYKVAGRNVYTIKHIVDHGGYKAGANIDPQFPNCANPLPPTYFNLIEFLGSRFGHSGETFSVEFYMTHRGMASSNYVEHFVFTGSVYSDSVSGFLDVKKSDGHFSVFISQPSGDREIAITSAHEGQRIPISLRDIGQGVGNGIARLTLKMDTRRQAGSTRAFAVKADYDASYTRPPVSLVNDSPVKWDV